MTRIVVIKGDRSPTDSSAQRFALNVNEKSAHPLVEVVAYRDLVFSFLANQLLVSYKNRPVQDLADAFYIRDYEGYAPERYALARYLAFKTKAVFNQDLLSNETHSKLEQLVAWSIAGLPVMDGIYAHKLPKQKDFPVIVKSIVGSNGQQNLLAKTEHELAEAFKTVGPKAIIQPYIENDGDYRVCIVADKVALTYKRVKSDESTHLNNVSMGAKRQIVNDKAIDELGLKAARVLNRQFCGVDIIQDKKSGQLLLLECNFNNGMAELDDGVDDAFYESAAKIVSQL